jgi:hypothetical protein
MVSRLCPHRVSDRRALAALGALCVAAVPLHATGDTIDASWNAPALDRWMYPFNATPGTRPVVSVFGSEPGGTDFDSRDAQFIIGFSTSAQVEPGLGASSYEVLSARLTLEFANDLVVVYDPTPDAWQTFLSTSDPNWQADSDAGQPVELFGCGFRNGWTAPTFAENSPFGSGNALLPSVRNAFAIGANGQGALVDVSNNPRQGFQPVPFAVGQVASLQPGDLIPFGAKMSFDLSVTHPAIQSYLRESLDAGRLLLVASSLTFVVQQGGNFPAFFAKENPLVAAGLARAAQLDVQVRIGGTCGPGDLNCDGSVDGTDLTALLSNWGGPGSTDVNGDGTTDGLDLTVLLGAWTG